MIDRRKRDCKIEGNYSILQKKLVMRIFFGIGRLQSFKYAQI